MVDAQHPLPIGQGLLKQGNCLGRPPDGPVGVGEVVARVQSIGVVDAQHPFPGGQGLFMHGDRFS